MKNKMGLASVRDLGDHTSELHTRGVPIRAILKQILPDGSLEVDSRAGQSWQCEFLLTGSALSLAPGDEVLVLPPEEPGLAAIVLGGIGGYAVPVQQPNVVIAATETLTLQCGEASIDLRADGKVMVRGEDVLLRAKGTQRIRAGTVSIN